MKTKHSLLLSALALGAASQGARAESDAWTLLDQIEIEEIVSETSYEVRKRFPAALDQGEIELEITGYAVPRLPGEVIDELILVADEGICPFCGSADHSASLQVLLAEAMSGPMMDESTRITLRGTLVPVRDPETWQAAILKDARIVTSK